jgi:hypothetical protein
MGAMDNDALTAEFVTLVILVELAQLKGMICKFKLGKRE